MNLFETDVYAVSADELLKRTEEELKRLVLAFVGHLLDEAKIETDIRTMQVIAYVALHEKAPSDALVFALKDLGGFKEAHERFDKDHRKVHRLLNRKAILDCVDAFESFVAGLNEILLFAFPRFLITPPDTAVAGTQFEDLFEAESLLAARRSVVRRRVKTLIQADNLLEVIEKSQRRFGVDLKISKTSRLALLELLAARNVLVHNAGVVNEIYMALMKRNEISTTYRVGDRVTLENTYVDDARALTKQVAGAIFDAIKGSLTQIARYHSAR